MGRNCVYPYRYCGKSRAQTSPTAGGDGGGLAPVRGVQLGENIGHVTIGRAQADEELRRRSRDRSGAGRAGPGLLARGPSGACSASDAAGDETRWSSAGCSIGTGPGSGALRRLPDLVHAGSAQHGCRHFARQRDRLLHRQAGPSTPLAVQRRRVKATVQASEAPLDDVAVTRCRDDGKGRAGIDGLGGAQQVRCGHWLLRDGSDGGQPAQGAGERRVITDIPGQRHRLDQGCRRLVQTSRC